MTPREISSPPPAITLQNVTLTHERRPAVHHVTGRFQPGSLTAIVGPNGAGKTTLLRAIAGLHPIAEGVIGRDGASPRAIGLLPQPSGLDRSFPVTCRDAVALGAYGRLGPFAKLPSMQVVATALGQVGLRGFERRLIGTLSAGQLQRLLFARLIVQDPVIVLLDEPFNAVDARTAADLLTIIGRWHAEGRTIVAVLHDMDLVARAFPQTLLLAREVLAWGETATVLSAENRLRARLTAEAWDDLAPVCRDAA